MEPKNLPTAMGWYSVELPGYRPGQGTYDFYEYDSLPPLPIELFTGTLDWLKTALGEIREIAEDLADEDALTEEDEEVKTRYKLAYKRSKTRLNHWGWFFQQLF